MFNKQVIAQRKIGSLFRIYSTILYLLILVISIGCFSSSQAVTDQDVIRRLPIRPINADSDSAAAIGEDALEKIGYTKIVEFARRANFVEYKELAETGFSNGIQLTSYGAISATAFVPVFSRYAVIAGVTSQADSPLPGPADIAAVGVIVIGLVDAGVLDGYLLRTVGEILSTGSRPMMAKGKTNASEKSAVDETSPQEADVDPNKLHHIFDKEEHALDDFVKSQGGQEQAFRAIQNAANQALREGRLVPGPNGLLPGGDAGPIIDVAGTKIRLIGGRVVNKIVQIASASRKGL